MPSAPDRALRISLYRRNSLPHYSALSPTRHKGNNAELGIMTRPLTSLHPSQILANLAQIPRSKGPHAPCAVLTAQLGRVRPFCLGDFGQSSPVL